MFIINELRIIGLYALHGKCRTKFQYYNVFSVNCNMLLCFSTKTIELKATG